MWSEHVLFHLCTHIFYLPTLNMQNQQGLFVILSGEARPPTTLCTHQKPSLLIARTLSEWPSTKPAWTPFIAPLCDTASSWAANKQQNNNAIVILRVCVCVCLCWPNLMGFIWGGGGCMDFCKEWNVSRICELFKMLVVIYKDIVPVVHFSAIWGY